MPRKDIITPVKWKKIALIGRRILAARLAAGVEREDLATALVDDEQEYETDAERQTLIENTDRAIRDLENNTTKARRPDIFLIMFLHQRFRLPSDFFLFGELEGIDPSRAADLRERVHSLSGSLARTRSSGKGKASASNTPAKPADRKEPKKARSPAQPEV